MTGNLLSGGTRPGASEDRGTIVEPDISVICDRDKLTDRGCTGAPDWIVEIISPGNSSHDYIRKPPYNHIRQSSPMERQNRQQDPIMVLLPILLLFCIIALSDNSK